MKMFFVQKLPCRRPLGLLRLWCVLVSVDFKCHEHVLIHVQMPQPKFAETAYFMDLIRDQIPYVNGLRWVGVALVRVEEDHFILLDINILRAKRKLSCFFLV